MNFLSPIKKRRTTGLVGACAVVLGGLAVAGAVPADAATSTPVPPPTCAASPGNPCVIVGTATLTSGGLGTVVPGPLTWAGTINGFGENLFDSVPADEGIMVDNAGGSMTGWHVTASATTFTAGASRLPDSGTFTITGSITSPTSAQPPTQSCTAGPGSCVLPDNSGTAYPARITTAETSPTPVTIYNAAAGTGIGAITIGGSATTYPVGWWLHVPGTAMPGTYTSTVTLNVVSGPI
jgi:hypothetical protein